MKRAGSFLSDCGVSSKSSRVSVSGTSAPSGGQSPSGKSLTPTLSLDACFGLCAAIFDKCVCSQKCNRCARSFGSPHPFAAKNPKRYQGLTLPRRRGRGRECDHCNNTKSWRYKGWTAQALKQHLDTVEGQNEFNDRREEWDNMHGIPEGDDNCRKRAPRGEVPEATVDTTKSDEYEMSLFQGYVWPLKQWEQHAKKPAPKSRQKLYDCFSPPVLGILEPSTFGWADGVYALYRKGRCKTELKVNVGSSAEGLSVGELEQQYKAISGHRAINVTEAINEDGSVELSVQPAKEQSNAIADDTDGEDDFLGAYAPCIARDIAAEDPKKGQPALPLAKADEDNAAHVEAPSPGTKQANKRRGTTKPRRDSSPPPRPTTGKMNAKALKARQMKEKTQGSCSSSS